MKNKLARTIAATTFAGIALPLFAVGASAQTTTTTTPAAPTTTTTTSTSTSVPAKRIITASNAKFQKNNRSTEPAVNAEVAPGSAWEVISTDSEFSEFASLVKAAGLEDLYSKAGTSTFIVPNNLAFAVLDQSQLSRLKDAKYKEQLGVIVRQHIATGVVNLGDFTRRLPTGLPVAPPTTVQNCSTTGGSLVNGVQVGGRTTCSSFTISAPTPPPAISTLTMLSGKTIPVQASVIADPSGGANHYRIAFPNAGFLEAADFTVKNGVVHTSDTLQMPAGSLTDIVGRR
jgi:uncharacterized surface protein with fasciclin (FAS1) repeats